MTKDEVYNIIAQASVFHGNLGLFVGAGFSKAVFKTGDVFSALSSKPLSWIELLKKICEQNDVDWTKNEADAFKCKSCPEIASIICKEIERKNGTSYQEVVADVKKQICGITSWYPDEKQREFCAPLLKKLNPKWIITTNYDRIIEGLLPDCVESLSPNDAFGGHFGLIPVYHMHGINTSPESLVITNEDYVQLFRPNSYRQQRLPFALMESVTLSIGYGIGDQNVITAMDWTRSVYQEISNKVCENRFVQLAYCTTPRKDPYEQDGVIILETNDVLATLKEINDKVEDFEKNSIEYKRSVANFMNAYMNASDDFVEKFMCNPEDRNPFFISINNAAKYLTSVACSFILKVAKKCWEKTARDGAFEEYRFLTDVLTDCFIKIKKENIHPALFEVLASELRKLAYYIDIENVSDFNCYRGKSVRAKRLWDSVKMNIPKDSLQDLISYAQQNQGNYPSMLNILSFLI